MIDVSLLGPPRVERDGRLVAFDTRKAVALLAHLALTDRPRPRDALADLLWPDTDPERSRGALRRTLSTLRGAIGGEHLESTRDHVRLVKGPGITVDIDRFRDQRAGGDLAGAVSLFRGEFLEGFGVRDAPAFEDWVRGEGEGLSRELTTTLADLARAREAAGDPAGAIHAVRWWLSIDPLHEPAHRALMRLYAASGDRGAALLQYRECVRTLSRELDVPPLAETTQLYEAINRGAYAAPAAVPPPRPVPEPLASPFVGRDHELQLLRATYDGIDTDGRVVVIEGEAGIGKTRLADQLITALRGQRARVLVGRGYEDEAGLAYAPIIDALRGRLLDVDDWQGAADTRALREAARLVPEIAAARPATAEATSDGPGAETRFLSGVWDTLGAAAKGPVPGVLFVDDVQWADEATLDLLGYGLRRLAGRPLLVLLTWRTPYELAPGGAEAVLSRAGGGSVLRLERLGEIAVDELARAVRPGEADPVLSRRLWETTEGVPLLLVEFLRALRDGADGPGVEDGAADHAWVVPTAARDMLRARLGPISETGRQVLAAAAVLGRSFDADTVREVSGRTDEETVAALEEVVARGLVREGHVDYDFDHELLRAHVYDETSLARRRLLHGRAAEVAGAPKAAVARHLQLAGRDADAAGAFWEAGEQARTVFANAEALGHLRAASALGHPDRIALQTAIGDLQTIMGDYAGALTSLEAAAAASGQAVQWPIEQRLGRLQHRRGEYELADAHLRAALDAAPPADAAARAGITADLSMACRSRGDLDQARSLAREAHRLAEQSADPRARCQAHNLLGMLATADGATDEALATLRRSRELAEQIGDRDLSVAVLNNLALAHRARGELDTATELTAEALRLCAAMGDRHREAALHNNLADLFQASGRRDDAMAHLKAAVEIFAEVGADAEPRPEIWKLVRW